MNRPRSRLFEFLLDDVNRMLVMLAVATGLGVGSVLLFFYTPERSPTRTQLLLLVSGSALLFYLALRSSTF